MLVWTEEYATGSRIIDAQHKELFRRTNALLEACDSGEGVQALNAVMNFMADYVVYHFGCEERLMEKLRYPGYLEHKLQHQQLIDDFVQSLEQMGAGKLSLPDVLRVHAFLSDWVRHHVMRTDKQMGAFFKTCGVDDDLDLVKDIVGELT